MDAQEILDRARLAGLRILVEDGQAWLHLGAELQEDPDLRELLKDYKQELIPILKEQKDRQREDARLRPMAYERRGERRSHFVPDR